MQWFTLYVIILVIRTSHAACLLSGSSPHCYVIRIYDTTNGDITHGHGALVRDDKVLSTCTPFKDLPVKLDETNWALSGYNFKEKCDQYRQADKIIMHESCPLIKNPGIPIANDLALWSPTSNFEVDFQIPPFLWGPGKYKPLPLTKVKEMIDNLNHRAETCKVSLFDNNKVTGHELQNDAKELFLPLSECIPFLKRSPIADYFSDNFTSIQDNFTFFCGIDHAIKWDDPKDAKFPVDPDWYSGAGVIYQEQPSSDPNSVVPIGFFSRAINGSSHSPNMNGYRLIIGFHQGVYDFLKAKAGIIPEFEPVPPPEPPCDLSDDSPYPYLIRIIKLNRLINPMVTMGHGSLIRPDAVLSTCTPFKDLPESLKYNRKWMLRGYNVPRFCHQSRPPLNLTMHPSCRNITDPLGILTDDYAVWTVTPFDITGPQALIWGDSQLPKMSLVESVVSSMYSNELTMKTGIFKEQKSGEAVRQTDAEIISMKTPETCVPVNVSSLKDSFFCGNDKNIQWIDRPNPSNPIGYDWYSGAVVTYRNQSVLGSKDLPIGLLSRTHTDPVKQTHYRYIMVFHARFYDFLTAFFPPKPITTTTTSSSSESTMTVGPRSPETPPAGSQRLSGGLAIPMILIVCQSLLPQYIV